MAKVPADGAVRGGRTARAAGARAAPRDRAAERAVCCYLCGRRFDVPARAMSTSCPGCHRAIRIEDVVVRTYVPTQEMQTCGSIVVERKGRVAARRITAGVALRCDGTIDGAVECTGPVVLGAHAAWKGQSLRSPALRIDDGATLIGHVCVQGGSPPGDADASGDVPDAAP